TPAGSASQRTWPVRSRRPPPDASASATSCRPGSPGPMVASSGPTRKAGFGGTGAAFATGAGPAAAGLAGATDLATGFAAVAAGGGDWPHPENPSKAPATERPRRRDLIRRPPSASIERAITTSVRRVALNPKILGFATQGEARIFRRVAC